MLGGGALGGDPALLFEEIMTEVLTLLMENLHPIMILSGLITILILCIAFRIRRKKPLAEIHLVPTSPIAPSTGLFSLLFGVALQAVVVITISFLPLSAELMDSLTESSLLLSGGPILVQFLNAAIVTPFVEELVFRGLVFTRLSRGMRTGAAVVLSAILFGTAHGTVIGFLYATLLGLVFAALMRRHGNSFFTSFLCHMGFNGASFLLTMVPDNQLLILAIYFASIAAALLLAYLLFRKPAEKTDA